MLKAQAKRFFELVSYGKQKEAEDFILQTDPADRAALICRPAEAKDYFGRPFRGLSGLQYTFWALDTPMRNMMMPYLSKEEISAQLRAYAAIPAEALPYGRHYDFGVLIAALQKYVDAHELPHQPWTQAERTAHAVARLAAWFNVSGAQRYSTIEVINRYAHPSKVFNAQAVLSDLGELQASERSDDFHPSPRDVKKSVFSLHERLDELGKGFGLVSLADRLVGYAQVRGTGDLPSVRNVQENLEGLIALANRRIYDYNDLVTEYAPELPLLKAAKPQADEKSEGPPAGGLDFA